MPLILDIKETISENIKHFGNRIKKSCDNTKTRWYNREKVPLQGEPLQTISMPPLHSSDTNGQIFYKV